MSNDIDKEISEILDDYSDKAVRAIEHASKQAADSTVKHLRATAPRRKGKYSRGFAVKKSGSGKNTTYTVYNKSAPGLTHLLEYGHMVRNQHGTYGRASARPHWAAAERLGIEEFEREVRNKLGE